MAAAVVVSAESSSRRGGYTKQKRGKWSWKWRQERSRRRRQRPRRHEWGRHSCHHQYDQINCCNMDRNGLLVPRVQAISVGSVSSLDGVGFMTRCSSRWAH